MDPQDPEEQESVLVSTLRLTVAMFIMNRVTKAQLDQQEHKEHKEDKVHLEILDQEEVLDYPVLQ